MNNSQTLFSREGHYDLIQWVCTGANFHQPSARLSASASEQSQATPDVRKFKKGLALSWSQKRGLRKLGGQFKVFQDEVEQREHEIKTLIESGNSSEADFHQNFLETDQGTHHQEFQRKLSAILTPDQRAQMAALQNQ